MAGANKRPYLVEFRARLILLGGSSIGTHEEPVTTLTPDMLGAGARKISGKDMSSGLGTGIANSL